MKKIMNSDSLTHCQNPDGNLKMHNEGTLSVGKNHSQ